jgi:hypothetical protein
VEPLNNNAQPDHAFLLVAELRDLIYREMALREQGHLAIHAEQSRALAVAYDSLTYRLEGMNQFRASLTDQAGTFPTRAEVSATHSAIDDRLIQLTEALQKLEVAHSAMQARLYTIFAALALVMGAINIPLALWR